MRSKFIACYMALFPAKDVARVNYTTEVLWTTDGHAWAFNGWETFYQLGTDTYRRRPTAHAPRKGARHD